MLRRWNLINARNKKGLTQPDIAELLGVSRSLINDYERGRAKPNDPEKKKILEGFFGIDIDALLETYDSTKEIRMKNDYEIRGDITAILLSYKGESLETVIDTVDLPLALKFPNRWAVRFDKTVNSFYVTGNMSVDGKMKTHQLHRWLFGTLEDGIQIDHINHDTLNNRRSCNLRKVEAGVNTQNRKGAQKNNLSSGIRGVGRKGNRWRARMQIDGKLTHLGYFDDIDEADRTVREARAKYMPYSQEALTF